MSVGSGRRSAGWVVALGTGEQVDYDGVLVGNRVLIVCAGNSGCDLAVDAAQHRIDTDMVIRHGVHFQPEAYFGVPRQEVP